MAKFVHIKRILDSVLTQEEFSVYLALKAPDDIERTYLNKKEIAKLLSEEEVRAETAILGLSRKLDDNTIEKVLYYEKEYHGQSSSFVFMEYEIKEDFWPVRLSGLSMNTIRLIFNEEKEKEEVYWNTNYSDLTIIIWSSFTETKKLVMSPKVFRGFLRQYTGFDNHQELFLAALNLKDIKEIRNLLASLTEMSKIIHEYVKLRTKNKVEKELRYLLGEIIPKIKDSEPKQFQASGEQYTLFFYLFPRLVLPLIPQIMPLPGRLTKRA